MVVLLPVALNGADLNELGIAIEDANGEFIYSRDMGRNPPKTHALRLNELADWYERQDRVRGGARQNAADELGVHAGASTADTHFGIQGLLRDSINELNGVDMGSQTEENEHITPFVNVDRLIFKIELPASTLGNTNNLTIIPITIDDNGNEIEGDPIELPLEPSPNNDNWHQTVNPILLYQDTNDQLDNTGNRVSDRLPPNIHLVEADQFRFQLANQNNQPAPFVAERLQIHIAANGTPMLEHDPAQNPGAAAQAVAAGNAITEPADGNHRYLYWINPDDQTPDVRLEIREEDGDEYQLPQGATTEWYLLYRIRSGSWGDNHGAKFDVWQWHRLLTDDGEARRITFPERNERWENRIEGDPDDDDDDLNQGGFQPGDYQIFARVTIGDRVIESNLIEFKILGQNPADAGRIDKENTAQYVVTFPQRIDQFVDALPIPERDGVQLPDFRGWYKGIILQESEYSGYSHRQNFDNHERVPETNYAGVPRRDIGFTRAFGGEQWDVRHAFPFVSFDNGWGITQQTRTDNTVIRVARWKANVIEGWHELTVEKLGFALSNVSIPVNNGNDEMSLRALFNPTNLPAATVQQIGTNRVYRQAVKAYNGGTQYERNAAGQVVEGPWPNNTYVDDVEDLKDALEN